VLLLVLGLLLGLVPLSVSVVLEDPATAQAARIPAPIGPPPDCSGDDNPNIGADCHALPSEGISVSATGIFGEGGSINFVTTMGMAPCESTSNSTDCYWSVDAPEISGCVYLHEGDPTDLRSCGFSYTNLYSSGTELPSSRDRFTYESGTATPFNGSPQTLRCGGGFSTVYIYGGDQRTDFRWAQRGPKLLNCNIDINMPRPDNLRGPSFVRVQADVRICGSDNSRSYCGTPSRTARASAWVPVDGDLAPAARFTAEPAGGGGLSYFFANQSIPFHDGATTYEWDFGDGTTSTAVSPSHTFASTGTKFVRLTMRSSDGQTLSATERIDLVPPDLAVTVFNPNAEFGPGKTGNRLNVGDEMTVRVKVRATDGVGHLDDVAPVDALLDLPDQFEFVQPDPPVDPFDPPTAPPRRFDPDDAAEYDVRIRAVSAGRATIRSTWNGDDAAGDPSGPWSGSFETSVTGLQVEILPDPDSFKRDDTDGDGDIDDDDNHVEVEVKVTNVSQAPITDITKGELLVTSKVEDDPLPQFLLVASPVDDPSTPDVDEGAFGDLDPGESHSITWTYRADEAVHVDLSMLVTGAQAGATVTSLGEGTVKAFDNVVLEAKIAPAANASYASGKPIRIDGEFTNVTDR
ncbi:MAG: PKD domain-containing protein, partial [Actinomycetota bacterium]